jgi:hypothetical protein
MQTPEIKASLIEMLNRLDNEFQQASMIVNLLKAMPSADTLGQDQLAQQNTQTLMDMIDQNIIDALSEAGQMLLAVCINNADGMQEIKMFENESQVGILEFDPKNIDGFHDVKVVPDRSNNSNKDMIAKQLIDFTSIVGKDLNTQARYPKLMEKIYKRWLELRGITDVDSFFDEPTIPTNPVPGAAGAPEIPPAAPVVPTLPAAPAAPPPAVVA